MQIMMMMILSLNDKNNDDDDDRSRDRMAINAHSSKKPTLQRELKGMMMMMITMIMMNMMDVMQDWGLQSLHIFLFHYVESRR